MRTAAFSQYCADDGFRMRITYVFGMNAEELKGFEKWLRLIVKQARRAAALEAALSGAGRGK
jgi:hypothetical protein